MLPLNWMDDALCREVGQELFFPDRSAVTRIGSLFTGYGGLDMAVQAVLGGELAWYSEIEPAACTVLAAHHPGVSNLGDITKVDWADVEPVDILTGGYPCQPFSHAGKRKGTDDERHLWPYVRDAIAAIRPMVAVFENVDGHRSLGLDVVLGDLASMGMSARWGVVRAADAGAPHGRKRVFIVAQPSDTDRVAWQTGSARLRRPGAVHQPRAVQRVERPNSNAASHAASVGQEPPRQARQRGSGLANSGGRGVTSDASLTGSQRPRYAEPQRLAVVTDRVATEADSASSQARGVSARRASGQPATGQRELVGGDAATRRGLASDTDDSARDQGVTRVGLPIIGSDGARPAADADGRKQGPQPRGDSAPLDRRRTWDPGTEPRRPAVDDPIAWGKYEPAIRRWEHLTRPAPAPTIAGTNGRPRLSPTFVEWMMGLPESHVTGHGLSNAQALKMLGNGVVPQQAEMALRLLLGGAA